MKHIDKKFINNLIIRQIKFNKNNKYSIVDRHDDSKYIFVGNLQTIKLYLKYSPYIKQFKDPQIVECKPYQYNRYVMNETMFPNIQIWCHKHTDVKWVVRQFKHFNHWINHLIHFNKNKMTDFLYSVSNNDPNSFISLLLSDILSKNILLLPGIDQSVNQLLENRFQVQIFNDTRDPQELLNLADSRRLDDNLDICNRCLDKLSENIRFNNLEKIVISLPSSLIINGFTDSIKKEHNNLPFIYNYTVLTDNYFNKEF